MKFLLMVLAIHFVAGMIGNKRKENRKTDVMNDRIRHPAEDNLRWD